jgi:putative ABC transport system permease protein
LGAGRARIVRLLIVESLVLAMAGAALGILLASSGLKALVAALPPFVIPSESVIALNAPVLMVTLGIAVLTALLCGLAPALQSFRRDLNDPLRDSGKGTSGRFRGRRLRDAVVVLEVALSVTLLIGAGLLMRSFVALRDVRLGLQPDHVFTTVLRLPEEGYATTEQVTAFLQPLLVRVKAFPGVVHAAASTAMPLTTRVARARSKSRARRQTASGKPCFSRSPRNTSRLWGSSSRRASPSAKTTSTMRGRSPW